MGRYSSIHDFTRNQIKNGINFLVKNINAFESSKLDLQSCRAKGNFTQRGIDDSDHRHHH